jgi:hypothetical protein
MNSLAVREAPNTVLVDLQNTHQLCQMLLKTPHYAKMGPEGIFAIVETAKSLNIDPRQALGGGLYYVKGKVEMSARLMNSLIRAQKHSITRDKRSDDTICILHGKRADNGDTWTESFSMADAQRAGLANNAVWKNFARDMLFARALSRLARQLFPDVIGNVYVEGELSLDSNIQGNKEENTYEAPQPVKVEAKTTAQIEAFKGVSRKEVDQLEEIIGTDDEYRQSVLKFLEKNCNIKSLYDIPREIYEKVLARATKNRSEKQVQFPNHHYGEASQMVCAVGGV